MKTVISTTGNKPWPVPGRGGTGPIHGPGGRGGIPQQGFTLLEILLVLVLMVMAAGLVLPALLNSGSAQIRSSSRMLAAGLQRSREYAINQQRSAAMVVDVNQRTLNVPGQARSRRLAPELKLEVFTARSELLDEARAGIRFYPDGSSSGGRITMSRGSQQAYVDVDWLTGRVRVQSGLPAAKARRLANRVQFQSLEGS